MKTKVKKLCINMLKDFGVFLVFVLFLLAIGVATNILVGITIHEYLIAT